MQHPASQQGQSLYSLCTHGAISHCVQAKDSGEAEVACHSMLVDIWNHTTGFDQCQDSCEALLNRL